MKVPEKLWDERSLQITIGHKKSYYIGYDNICASRLNMFYNLIDDSLSTRYIVQWSMSLYRQAILCGIVAETQDKVFSHVHWSQSCSNTQHMV